MTSLVEVLTLLRRVRSLQFVAESEAATGWNGAGTGSVVVSEPAVGVVVFHETGSWQPNASGRPAIRFFNVFRWSAVGDVLRLEHLRAGPDSPVLLFDLAPAGNDEWREVRPHWCRDDCYAASLRVEGEQLTVAWTVVGPHKRESIRYAYR
jgi:hypothetical protein